MSDVEWQQIMTKAWLELWIESNERPAWLDWFGLYPAKASVNAAKTQLKAMNNHGLVVDIMDLKCWGFFMETKK